MTFTELMALDHPSPAPKALPPAKHDTMTPRHHDSMPSRYHDATASSKQDSHAATKRDTTTPRQRGRVTPRRPATTTLATPASLISRLRGAVKPLGKEVSTHRFSVAEKERLTEIVYGYERRGYRTSENEIVRIAVNWLLEDHAARGKRGVLHRTLRALYE